MKHNILTLFAAILLGSIPQNASAQLVVSAEYGYPQLMGLEVEYQTPFRVSPYLEVGLVNRAFGLRTYGQKGVNFKSAVGVQFGQTAMVDVGGGGYVSSYVGLYGRFKQIQFGIEGGGLYGPRWGDLTTGQGDVYFPHIQLKAGVILGPPKKQTKS